MSHTRSLRARRRATILVSLAAALIAACSAPPAERAVPAAAAARPAEPAPAAPVTLAAAESASVTVYKSPTCGCCNKWVDHLRAHGFRVETHDTDDMAAIKADMGVPERLGSCHTAAVGGYIVEGHVPADVIARLLRERPAIAGLAVPGMPAGSPGMEGPYSERYDVLAMHRGGSTSVYASR